MKLPGIAMDDIGKCARGIFRNGGKYVGKSLVVGGEHPSGQAREAVISRSLGKTMRYHAVPFEVYRKLGFRGADDLGNMFRFKHDFNDIVCGHWTPAVARALNPSFRTFEQWLMQNKSRIPLNS